MPQHGQLVELPAGSGFLGGSVLGDRPLEEELLPSLRSPLRADLGSRPFAFEHERLELARERAFPLAVGNEPSAQRAGPPGKSPAGRELAGRGTARSL